MKNLLLPLALRDYAWHLIQPAIGARSAMFDDITPDFACSAALTSLGSSSLDLPAICSDPKARSTGIALWGGLFRRRRSGFGAHDGQCRSSLSQWSILIGRCREVL